MHRRQFLASTLAAAATSGLARAREGGPKKKILLRSSWASVNIGDIAHTPGMLRLMETYLPDCDVTLWPTSVDNGVAELLKKRFPKLEIMGKDPAEKKRVFETHDFLLHGSGPNLGGEHAILDWTRETTKPYGIGGITWFRTKGESRRLISGAKFAFLRDSISLQTVKDVGMTCPIMEFGPDATFACDLLANDAADAWLKEVGLEQGKFMCCISRLRITPYWDIKPGVPFSEKAHARNEEMKEHDTKPLRDAVIAVVRQTSMKILLCPEDASQMKVNKEMIYDQLPEDVKSQVVWRQDYWLTDFARSVYSRSAGLFGNEQHSPIMCISLGVPAIVCRFKEQSSKGVMWKDIGLPEWLFDHDKGEPAQGLTTAVLAIANDPAAAKAKALRAKEFVDDRMKHMMEVLGSTLSA